MPRGPDRSPRRFWTADEDAQLRARYPHESSAVLASDLHRQLSGIYQRARALRLRKTQTYLESPAACRLRRVGEEHPGRATQFKKGLVPANKGWRRPGWHRGRMKETQFKAGIPS